MPFWPARNLFKPPLAILSCARSHHSEDVASNDVAPQETGPQSRPVRLFLELLPTTPSIFDSLEAPALPSCVVRGGSAGCDLASGTLGIPSPAYPASLVCLSFSTEDLAPFRKCFCYNACLPKPAFDLPFLSCFIFVLLYDLLSSFFNHSVRIFHCLHICFPV